MSGAADAATVVTLDERVAQFPASSTEGDIAAALNAPSAAHGTKNCDVGAMAVRETLFPTGAWLKVLLRDGRGPLSDTDMVWANCRALVQMVEQEGTFRTSGREMLAALTASLSALWKGSVIEQVDKEAVLALTQAPMSEAEKAGCGYQTAETIGAVRVKE